MAIQDESQPMLLNQVPPVSVNNSVWLLEGRTDGGDRIRTIKLNRFPMQVGRSSDVPLTLACSAVSALHAEFFLAGEALCVRDLNSTNGTYVNGNRVATQVAVREGDLVQIGRIVLRVGRCAQSDTKATMTEDVCDRAFALAQFDRLMSDRAIVTHFQPIVTLQTGATIAYEILGRSRLFGLRNPREMFLAASQLSCEAQLSRMFRVEGVRRGAALPDRPHLFLNTHPVEVVDVPKLLKSLVKARALTHQPLTLEIHEAAVTNSAAMQEIRAALRELNITMAYDDFGVGQGRLNDMVDVRPDYLKFDAKLVRNIHAATDERKQMLRNLVMMARDLGIITLAKGVERREDGDACRELGFDLGQGFFYGKPADLTHHCGARSSDVG